MASLEDIKKILDKYSNKNYKLFYETVDMLCAKGISNGAYQDYTVLQDAVAILSICECIIKQKK